MVTKLSLPIDNLNDQAFDIEIKRKHLDDVVLSDDAIGRIKDLFLVGTPHPGTARVDCDDYHPHTYKCVYFYNPATAVVDRLIQEIETYKSKLARIKAITRLK